MLNNFCVSLPTLAATEHCAQSLAHALMALEKGAVQPALLFQGSLGAGKTTFTRALVHTLPDGVLAEVASPSFTLCNTYNTTPPIIHCDLYRCAYALPEDLWDALETSHILTIVEWAEYMPSDAFPKDYLDISLKICEEGRLLEVTSHGLQAGTLLALWQQRLIKLPVK